MTTLFTDDWREADLDAVAVAYGTVTVVEWLKDGTVRSLDDGTDVLNVAALPDYYEEELDGFDILGREVDTP